MGPIPILLLSLAAGGLLLTGCQVTRAGYESAPYSVVRSEGRFEIRDYPSLVVVETPMRGARDGSDGSFNRLFRYISGSNADDEKIAMTTPVFMSGDSTNATMAFVMPTQLSLTEVPRPADEAVTVREVPAGSFAVYRFRGGRSSENEQEAWSSLETWMQSQGLSAQSTAIYAYFDPPWIPGFLRRNEVMAQLTPKP